LPSIEQIFVSATSIFLNPMFLASIYGHSSANTKYIN
jgi:hypothetical protein